MVAYFFVFQFQCVNWVLCYVKLNQRSVRCVKPVAIISFHLSVQFNWAMFCNFSQIINSIGAQNTWYNSGFWCEIFRLINFEVDVEIKQQQQQIHKYAHHKYYIYILRFTSSSLPLRNSHKSTLFFTFFCFFRFIPHFCFCFRDWIFDLYLEFDRWTQYRNLALFMICTIFIHFVWKLLLCLGAGTATFITPSNCNLTFII